MFSHYDFRVLIPKLFIIYDCHLIFTENIQCFLATFNRKEISANDVINKIEKKSIQDKVEKVTEKQIMTKVKPAFKRIKVGGKRYKIEGSDENKKFYTNNGFDHSRYGALKIPLVLFLIIRGRNQKTDGEGLSLRSGLCQDLSLGDQSI